MLSEKEWMKINRILLELYSINDLEELAYKMMRVFRMLIPFSQGYFCLLDTEQQVDREHSYFWGMGEETKQRYLDEFYDKDYLKFLYEISVDTTVYRDTDILEENIRKSTEFFKKFLKPEGIPYGCGILLIRNQRVLGILNLFRNNENGDFTDKEMFILDVLKNHLENMVHNTVYHSRQGMAAKQYLEQAAENYDLIPRELEILELIGEGLSNQEICDKLVISTSTVKKHIYNLFQKTNVSSRTQLLNRIYKF